MRHRMDATRLPLHMPEQLRQLDSAAGLNKGSTANIRSADLITSIANIRNAESVAMHVR
jgi:hypothetical protein